MGVVNNLKLDRSVVRICSKPLWSHISRVLGLRKKYSAKTNRVSCKVFWWLALINSNSTQVLNCGCYSIYYLVSAKIYDAANGIH